MSKARTPDDRREFAAARHQRLERLREDHPVWGASREFLDETLKLEYSYNFDWLGVPIIQYPQDVVAMQELCWQVRPDLIIETGVARGGSVIFYASMLELLGEGGQVIGIDIDIRDHNRFAIERHPLAHRVILIEGSSTSPETVEEVRRHAGRSQRTMVVLDSHHTKDHVARELELYSPFVRSGSYIVVFDTVVEYAASATVRGREWGPGNNPFNAVQQFLEINERFVIDRLIDRKLIMSAALSGYLKCVRDPA